MTAEDYLEEYEKDTEEVLERLLKKYGYEEYEMVRESVELGFNKGLEKALEVLGRDGE